MSRISEGYEPRFDIDNAYGQEGERYVANIIDGFTNGRVEVKRDAISQKSKRVYVEYKCRRGDMWVPSGLATTEADVWVFVLGDSGIFVGVGTDALKQLAREFYNDPSEQYRKQEKDGSHPTLGVVIPLERLVLAACVMD